MLLPIIRLLVWLTMTCHHCSRVHKRSLSSILNSHLSQHRKKLQWTCEALITFTALLIWSLLTFPSQHLRLSADWIHHHCHNPNSNSSTIPTKLPPERGALPPAPGGTLALTKNEASTGVIYSAQDRFWYVNYPNDWSVFCMHLPTDFYLSYPNQVRAKTPTSLTSPHVPQNKLQGQTLSTRARTELTGLHRSVSLHFMLE